MSHHVPALLFLVLFASCRGLQVVPTVGGAYHEETDSTSAMVALSFVSSGDEVPRDGSFWDGPVGSSLRPEPSAYTTDQEHPASAFGGEGSGPDSQPVTIETPWGTFKFAGLSVAAIAAACLIAQRFGLLGRNNSEPT